MSGVQRGSLVQGVGRGQLTSRPSLRFLQGLGSVELFTQREEAKRTDSMSIARAKETLLPCQTNLRIRCKYWASFDRSTRILVPVLLGGDAGALGDLPVLSPTLALRLTAPYLARRHWLC